MKNASSVSLPETFDRKRDESSLETVNSGFCRIVKQRRGRLEELGTEFPHACEYQSAAKNELKENVYQFCLRLGITQCFSFVLCGTVTKRNS